MKDLLLRCVVVAVGGSVGAVARYVVALGFVRAFPRVRFPVGTLAINVTGSLFLGWFLAHFASRPLSDTARLAVGVGFVGAYTTFSTFMFESSRLADDGAGLEAIMNLLGSLMLGLLAVRLGVLIARYV